MLNIKNKNFIKYITTLVFIIGYLFNISLVSASVINFYPSSGYYTIGDTIKIKVQIESDVSVNAVSAKILFPANLLSLSSVSKSGSIINIWAQEPTFSNTEGSANLEGVVLSGYTGKSGEIITLIFKAKNEGVATLNFSNASVLANNGEGTETLTNKSNSTLHIAKGVSTQKNTETEKVETNIEMPVKQEITDTAKEVVDKVIKIEQENNLPNYSLVFSLVLIIIVLLILIIVYGIFYIKKLNHYFKRRMIEAEDDVTKNFGLIENEINEEISIANKIKNNEVLKPEEIFFQSQLQKDIKITEENIRKELKDIEPE